MGVIFAYANALFSDSKETDIDPPQKVMLSSFL